MKLRWERLSREPYLSPAQGTLASQAVTTPDVLVMDGEVILIAGAVAEGRERLIRLPLEPAGLDRGAGASVRQALLLLDAGPHDYDRDHVYDPAAVSTPEGVLLFYSAIGREADSIGEAIWQDGHTIVKADQAVCRGRAPEVVLRDGKLYLYYVLLVGRGGYRIHASVSKDMRPFQAGSTSIVLEAGAAGSWDSYEVTTPRIFERNGIHYMMYAGGSSQDRKDQPAAFGLARSADLINWERYPFNPVFKVGEAGQWDDGAIWFGTVFEWDHQLYLFYEAGRLHDLAKDSPGLTQIGLARVSCADFDRAISEWQG